MIGENIRRIRTQKRITQMALAESAGISAQQLNQIEWGRSLPSVKSLVRLAAALKCTTDEILAEEVNDGTANP